MRSAFPDNGSRIGTFLKTASSTIIEVLATTPLDFAVVDAEHAPFDRRDIDLLMLASRATGLPLLVRVANHDPAAILSALDLGAAGIVVPHVDSVAVARGAVAAARYRGGSRGYSSGTRLGGYGSASMESTLGRGDAALVVAQIEHPEAVEVADDIAAVDGIAGILIGRADLALAMGLANSSAPRYRGGGNRAGENAGTGKIAGLVTTNAHERAHYETLGANWFLVGTDHGFLRNGVMAALNC